VMGVLVVEIPEEEEYEEMAECPTCGATIPIDALVCPNCGQEFEEEVEEAEEVGESPEALFEESIVEMEEEEEEGEPEYDVIEEEEEYLGEEEYAEGDEYAGEEEYGEEEYVEGGEEYVEEPAEGEGFEEEVPAEAAVVGPPPLTAEEEELAAAEAFDEEKPAKMFWIGFILTMLGFFGGPLLSYLHDALRIPIGMFTAYEKFGWVNWTVTIVGMVIMVIGLVFLFWGYLKIKEWRERIEAMLESPEPTVDVIE
ncbi:MAG: zinc ribbon domain-containing protein, partial [Thermoplasmata archaeon]|nr:zinc ribbon domain-containing protein [Thermoplasmata archaeon]